jgi:hypothetical protein
LPQLLGSLAVFVEQFVPSPGQLAVPAAQLLTPHFRGVPVQVGVPPALMHTVPQAPQLSMVSSGVLHPSSGLPLQFP